MIKKIKLSIVGLCLAATLMTPLASANAQHPEPPGGGSVSGSGAKVWRCHYVWWGAKICWWG